MNWKMKSAVQRACAHIPLGRQALYYQLQCRCGKLTKGYDYSFLFRETARLANLLRDYAFQVDGASVLEVGTGWRVDIPIALYLCGARRVVTCDLNRYLVASLVLKTIRYLSENQDTIRNIFWFVEPSLLQDRLTILANVSTIEQLFLATGIEYLAPFDCSRTGLQNGSIDLHFSYTVFEHIPRQTLRAILLEANRLLSDRGVALHHIDLSDHFEQVDQSITKVNFLRFSESEWSRYSNTPWSYHNRLREDDFQKIFRGASQDVMHWGPITDVRSLSCLNNGFPLAPEFRNKPVEMLSVVLLDAISRPDRGLQLGPKSLMDLN